MFFQQFPPYATNETGRPGAVGRRELGHGLASAVFEFSFEKNLALDFFFHIYHERGFSYGREIVPLFHVYGIEWQNS